MLLPLGLYLYWWPPLSLLAATPLWLIRGLGAGVTAWGASLAFGGYRSDPTGRVFLVAGNLLLATTLGAAALNSDVAALRGTLLGFAALLLGLGLLGLLAPEPPQQGERQ